MLVAIIFFFSQNVVHGYIHKTNLDLIVTEIEAAVFILVQQVFFLRIDDSRCNRIHSCLIPVHCFADGNVGKQPVAWKEYCQEYL